MGGKVQSRMLYIVAQFEIHLNNLESGNGISHPPPRLMTSRLKVQASSSLQSQSCWIIKDIHGRLYAKPLLKKLNNVNKNLKAIKGLRVEVKPAQ